MVLPNENNSAILFKFKNSDGYNYLTITQNNFNTYKNDLLNSNFKSEVMDLIKELNKHDKNLNEMAKFFNNLNKVSFLPEHENFNTVDMRSPIGELRGNIGNKIIFLKDILNKLDK